MGNFAATGKPTISGGAWVGATLTADASDISDEDGLGAFSYQWIHRESGTDTDISGATSSTYTLTDDDVGKTLKARVSFTDGKGYSESRTSDATEAVTARPPNSPATGKPTLTGTLAVGQTLTADTTGIADANGLGAFSYLWGHSEGGTSTVIFGAVGETYTLTGADKGKYMLLQVQFTDGDGYTESPSSDPVGPVGAPLPPGMTISPLMLEIDEGRFKLYSVTLNAQPTANVTINISGHSGTDLSLSHTSLTFIPQGWNTPGVVKVNAEEDNDELDDMVTLIHTVAAGSAPEMSVAAVNLPVTINDNDKSNVVVPSRTTLTVGEGGSGSYTVKLSEEPTAGVTVNITGHSGTDVSVSPSNISFTTANWNTARTVQVSAADDHDSTNDSVTLAHTVAAGSAQEFTGAPAVNVAVTVTDNDTPGVAISKSALEIDEGESDRYTVRLNTQPPANVTITVGGHSGTGVSPSPASLTFTMTNWSTPQTVTVSAAQDDDAMDATVTLTHAVSGTGDYASVTAADVEVTVGDDDTPGVVVSPSPLRVDEGGSASYKVRLATLPTAGVTVTVSGHSGTVLSSVSPTTLSFTRSNWKTEQTVAVRAPEDDDSSNETVTLSHAASGSAAEYAGLSTDLRVNVFDNDTVHVPGPYYAPSDLVVYVVRDTSDQAVWGGWPFPIKESHLHWRDPDAAPQAWNNDADAGTDLHHKYRYNQGFGRYEVERRTRGTDLAWSNWEAVELCNNPPNLSDRGGGPNDPTEAPPECDPPANDQAVTLTRTQWQKQVRMPVNLSGSCTDREWRVRAIYDEIPGSNPPVLPRYSDWVTKRLHTIEARGRPGAPGLDRDGSWLRNDGGDSYSLEFRWEDPRTRCWPTYGYDVQRREFLGFHYGVGTPPDGTQLTSSAGTVTWDPATMTKDGHRVWSNWTSVETPGGDKRRHAHSFEGKRNFQFRVRARNTEGWGPWSKPLLFSVDLSWTNDLVIRVGDEPGTSRSTAPPVDESQRLTAGFEDGPESHNGADAFTIRVAFSEAVSISADDLLDHALEVLGGTVTAARQVDGRADLWEITIQPDSGGAVSILLPPPADCGDRGAVCTGDGRALLAGLAVQVPGPPLLSVADAQALEGPDATLDFVVTRGGVRSGTATVDYATANGTATAGSDYFPTSGTLTFQPGDRTKTVQVPVYDDTVPDSGETLTLTLSNASGAEIADGEATGTILNVEPNLPATGTPTTSGTPQVGGILRAVTTGIGDPNGMTDAVLGYQWVWSEGVEDTDIPGATAWTYALGDADLGRTVRVRVSFTDDAGFAESITSGPADRRGRLRRGPTSRRRTLSRCGRRTCWWWNTPPFPSVRPAPTSSPTRGAARASRPSPCGTTRRGGSFTWRLRMLFPEKMT